MTDQNSVPQVHASIVAVADALREQGISKNDTVSGGGNYRYRGIDSVYAALSPLLAKHHLYIAPVRMEKEPEAVSGKMRLIRLQITYRVTCSIDGSYIEVVTLGDGMDTGDKASGKAMSYAYKSLMFQLFCIPVVGQPDTDKDASPEEPPPLPDRRHHRFSTVCRGLRLGGVQGLLRRHHPRPEKSDGELWPSRRTQVHGGQCRRRGRINISLRRNNGIRKQGNHPRQRRSGS